MRVLTCWLIYAVDVLARVVEEGANLNEDSHLALLPTDPFRA